LRWLFLSYPSAGGRAARKKEDNVLSPDTQAAAAAGTEAAVMANNAQPTSEELLARILSSLSDDKAEDVVQIDLRGKTEIGDYMIIASGRSTRQVAALAQQLVDRIKQEFGFTAKLEGKGAGDWVLIDTGDVIVHLFRPEVREFYQLEKMWLPAGGTAAN
jgi:ribosome-associated protein